MSEERRRELVEMGFPDDGYDYLKHMRAPGRGGRANLEGAGPMADTAGHTTSWPRKHPGLGSVTSSSSLQH